MLNQNTLLISDGYFSENFIDANEILINFFSKEFEQDSLIRAILMRDYPVINYPVSWNGFKYVKIKRYKENRFSSWQRVIPLTLNFFTYTYLFLFVIGKQKRLISKILRSEKISKLWIVITSPQLVFLAKSIIKKYSYLKVYTTVWDSPDEFSLVLNMPNLFRKKLLHDFSHILKHSERLGVASEEMQNEYSKKFHKECIVLQGDVSAGFIGTDDTFVCSDKIVIGYAGSFYTPEVWLALFQALDIVNWKLDDKKVIIRYIGNSFPLSPPSRCQIEFLGKQSVEEVINILSASTVNFVPYRFSQIARYGSSVSFPSKIVTYLAAKKPIFTIAPNYSTPYNFVTKNQVGIACNSLLPEEVYKSLNQFVGDETFYQKMIDNGNIVYNDCFRQDILRNKFLKFIS